MTIRRRWRSAIGALALSIFAAGTALGYAGEIANSVTVTRVTDPVVCCKPLTLQATVRDANGKLIAGQPVIWSWVSRVSTDDKINPPDTAAQSTTNANGVARITVTLAAVPGSRVVRATADQASGQVTINLTAAGLPRTSTLESGTPAPADQLLGTLLALLALVGGGGFALRGALARR